MKFTDFINELSERQFRGYAKRAKVSPSYLRTHLLHAYKEPRKRLREALVKQSRGKVKGNECSSTYHPGRKLEEIHVGGMAQAVWGMVSGHRNLYHGDQ